MVNSWICCRIKSEYTVMLLKAKESLLSQSKNVDTSLAVASFILIFLWLIIIIVMMMMMMMMMIKILFQEGST